MAVVAEDEEVAKSGKDDSKEKENEKKDEKKDEKEDSKGKDDSQEKMEKEDKRRDMEKTDSRRERERPQRRGSRREKRDGDENKSVRSKRSARGGSDRKDEVRSERRKRRPSMRDANGSVGGGSYKSKRSQGSRKSRGKRGSRLGNDLEEKISLLTKELHEEKGKIVEIQEGLENEALSEDIYSMLMISKPWSTPFIYSLMIFMFQLGTYVLIIYDFLQTKKPAEYLNPPINVQTPVRFAQWFALIVALSTQGDVTASVTTIGMLLDAEAYEQFSEAVLESQSRSNEKTRFNCGGGRKNLPYILYGANVCRMCQGFAGEACDDITQEVSGLKVPEQPRRIWTNGGFILFCLLIPMATYLLVVGKLQADGYFQPNNMFVTFGDEVNPSAQSHNGLYTMTHLKSYNRFIYEENNTRGSRSGYFVYCSLDRDKKWTFLTLTDDQFKKGKDEKFKTACENDVLAYSENFVGVGPFAPYQADQDGWKIRSDLGMFTDLDFLNLEPAEFRRDMDCGELIGRSSYSGEIVLEKGEFFGHCNCKGNYHGPNCMRKASCRIIEIQDPMKKFTGFANIFYSYDTLDKLTFNDEAVYIHNYGNTTEPNYDLILNTGNRWVLLKASKADYFPVWKIWVLTLVTAFI